MWEDHTAASVPVRGGLHHPRQDRSDSAQESGGHGHGQQGGGGAGALQQHCQLPDQVSGSPVSVKG